jgi:hypothetical protein
MDFKQWLGCGVVLFSSTNVFAWDEYTIVATDRGWYNSLGESDDAPPDYPTPNYFAGMDTINTEFRNWFVFDLTPVQGTIVGMTIHLGMPDGNPEHPLITGGYRSPHPFENYEMYSVETSPATLMGGNAGLAAFNDLGAGSFFGNMFITEAQEGQVLGIPLNPSAMASAMASINSDKEWAIGGRVSTLIPINQWQGVFAGSHSGPVNNVFISIQTAVPSPSAALLLWAGVISSHRRRQRSAGFESRSHKGIRHAK